MKRIVPFLPSRLRLRRPLGATAHTSASGSWHEARKVRRAVTDRTVIDFRDRLRLRGPQAGGAVGSLAARRNIARRIDPPVLRSTARSSRRYALGVRNTPEL